MHDVSIAMIAKPTSDQNLDIQIEKVFRIIYKGESGSLATSSTTPVHIEATENVRADKIRTLCTFSDPILTAVLLEELTIKGDTQLDTLTDPCVVCLPPGSKHKERFEKWVRHDSSKTYRVTNKSTELFLNGKRALIIVENGLLNDALVLLSAVIHYENYLSKIEETISNSWETLRNDLHFTHQVSEKEIAHWPHVQRMTTMAGELRISLERLSPVYSGLEDSAPLAVQKLAGRLIEELLVEDRIEAVSDQLEVFEDTYELANDRISEFTYFKTEAKLEIWIIIILVLELVFMLAEIIVTVCLNK